MTGHAAAQERGTLSLTYENDYFGPTDRNYTNGVRAGWVTAPKEPFGAERAVLGVLGGDDAALRRSYALGHSIFTPRDTLATEPLPDQHPYAAHLYAEYGLLAESKGRLDRLAVQLGIVGPTAGGAWIQNEFHDIVDTEPVLGWDNQVGDEVVVGISYDTQRRLFAAGTGNIGVEVVPSAGATLGNFQTNARAGLTVRAGSEIGAPYGPVRVSPGLPGAGYMPRGDGFGWSVFAGVQGRAVAHDITLDGSFLDGDGDPSVDSEAFVGDVQAGAVLRWNNVQLAYTHVLRSKAFAQQRGLHEFGSLTLSLRL